MLMKYRIISLDHKENSAIIRFYTDTINEDFLASSFDINNNIVRTDVGYPERCRTDVNITFYKTDSTEEDMHKLIESHAPIDWFKLQENLNINISPVRSLKIGSERQFTHVPAEEDLLSDEEIDKLLEQLTTKN